MGSVFLTALWEPFTGRWVMAGETLVVPTWKGLCECVKLTKMSRSRKAIPSKNSMALRQRRRTRPSQVKTGLSSPPIPGERLRLALELSDFCLSLREAGRRP